MSLPPPRVEERRERFGRLWVVREDELPGGTKRRVAPLILDGRPAIYPTPAEGYAQVALAHACADLGIPFTVVVAARREEHMATRAARAAGAEIIGVRPGYLSVVRRMAHDLAASRDAQLVPFSLRHPDVLEGLAQIARETFASLPETPVELWSVVGSGLLNRALQEALPDVPCYGVQIGGAGVLLEDGIGRARLLRAPEHFALPARWPPPFPSVSEYDAKAWQFIQPLAQDGALFWNVAG